MGKKKENVIYFKTKENDNKDNVSGVISSDKKVRSRRYFICIYESNPVYKDLELFLYKHFTEFAYCYICHNDKHVTDYDTICENHIHLILMLKNARSSDVIFKLFNGAHVDIIKCLPKCFRYLIHADDFDKAHYSLDDIVSNMPKSLINSYIHGSLYESLDTDSLLADLTNGVVFNMASAVKRYGLNQVNKYRTLIKDLIDELYNGSMGYLPKDINFWRNKIDTSKFFDDLKVIYDDDKEGS